MTDKLDVKDYLNYSISGFLWFVIIILILFQSQILTSGYINQFLKIPNSIIIVTVIVFVSSYILGNIFRFTDIFIISLTKLFYGDLYYSALITDRDKYLTSKPIIKIKKLGLLFYFFHIKTISIGSKSSKQIEQNLVKLNILNNSKKNQHIMAETFLILRFSNLKYERQKNLANFYESLSFPLLSCISILLYLTVNYVGFSLFWKSFYSLALLGIMIQFIRRYKFLQANYIKDVYRYFIFDKCVE
jgi:hypothetical protein